MPHPAIALKREEGLHRPEQTDMGGGEDCRRIRIKVGRRILGQGRVDGRPIESKGRYPGEQLHCMLTPSTAALHRLLEFVPMILLMHILGVPYWW